jgi:hypothetical protein
MSFSRTAKAELVEKKETKRRTIAMKEQAKKMKEEAIVKHAPLTDARITIPDYLRPKGGRPAGGENVDQTDVTIPRLALCQSMSDERKRGDSKFIPGLEEGMYFNSVSKKIYGDNVLVVPVFFYRTRIRFEDREKGGGILCQAQDAKTGVGDPGGDCLSCKLSQFVDGERPGCTEFKNMACLVVPEEGLPKLEDAVIFGFKSTSIKAAKTWNTLLRMRGLDYFSSIFEVTSKIEKNSKGTYYIPSISFSNKRVDCSSQDKNQPPSLVSPEMHAIGSSVYLGMKQLQAQGRLRVDLEDSIEREPGSDDEVDSQEEEKPKSRSKAPF